MLQELLNVFIVPPMLEKNREPVYLVIMHFEVWIRTDTNTLLIVLYEYSTCAYMDAIPCATLFQGFNIYPLVFRRVLC